MKYHHLVAFEKHLEQAAKVQLSSIFLLVSSCSYERKKILEKIVAAVNRKEGECPLHLQDAAQSTVEALVEDLNTASLLAGKRIVYLDNIEKIKKSELTALATYAAHPSPFAYLVLGAGSAKALSELMTKGKKELISCDLSEEKPWDRKDRLKRFVTEFAAKQGKRLQTDAAEYLLENMGMSLPGLEQELTKLALYVGERRDILLQDAKVLTAPLKTQTLWQLADQIAWGDTFPRLDPAFDLSSLLPLIAQLRTQLQHGLSLCVLLERKVPSSDIAHYFPGIKPAALDKMQLICRRRRSSFFRQALDFLFEAELMAKNSSLDPALILEFFVSKLRVL